MRDKSQKSISKIWPGSKWYITCHGCCLIWCPKLFSPCQIPLFSIDFWNVQWAIPPSVPWRLVAHFVTTGLICFSLKAKTNTSKYIPLLQTSQSSLPFHNHTIYISTTVDWYTCFMKHRCSSVSCNSFTYLFNYHLTAHNWQKFKKYIPSMSLQ